MSVEFTPEGEELEVVDFEYPDTLLMSEVAAHFAGDAQAWLAYWCERMGQEIDGAAFTVGEGGGIAILCTSTGQWMTPEAIVKREREASKPRAVK